MGKHALIYVQAGHVSAKKQVKACLEKIDEGWTYSYLRPGAWKEGAELIRNNQADVFLMAHGPRTDKQAEEHQRIRIAVEEAGGEVVYCRPVAEPAPRHLPAGAPEMVKRMFEAGCNTDQIVQVLHEPRTTVKQILSRLRDTAVLAIPIVISAIDTYGNIIG